MEAEVKPIINLSSGLVVCERASIADRPRARMKGLLGRDSLPVGEGLLLHPAPSIHTAFMRFAIDAVFVDRDHRVVGVVERMKPWRVAAKRGARAVLELAAGEAHRRGVAAGDQLAVLDSNALPIGDERDGQQLAVLSDPELDPGLERASRDLDDGPRSLRVLVVAHDRRFRTVASALLSRRGCEVATSSGANQITELVARERADVVVIDAGARLTAAARTVATVAAIQPPVGVVLVDDEAETGLQNMPVLAKWGAFEDFYAAVEQADRDRGRRSRLVG